MRWLASSHAAVLSEVVDVRLVPTGKLDAPERLAGEETTLARTVMVFYRADDQSSVIQAKEFLEALSVMDSLKGSATFVIENHLEEVFEGSRIEVSSLPETLGKVVNSLHCGATCDKPVKCWALKVCDGVEVSGLLHEAIVTPALSLLSAVDKTKLISVACRDGKVQVLKLLLTTVADTDPSIWLNLAMANLEQEGVLGSQSPALLEVARFAYNLDPTFCQSAVVRLAEKYPHSSLILLHELCGHQSHSENHFVKNGLSLVSLPTSWVQNPKITYIDLSGNLLSSVPDDLFKLPQLTHLNISHNRIASVPSILAWNCPLLRTLDVSHNKLADTHYEFLVQQPGVSPEQKRTGFTLHARVRSITTVIISHNTLLTNVPEWVCLLPNLSILEMTGLPSLTTLTPYLSHCRFMCVLKVDKERLKSPPPEVVLEGTRTVMAYLRCKLRGSSPYRHVKVIVMGDKGSGKSTLFAQMVNSKNKGGGDAIQEGTTVYPPKSQRRDRSKTTFHVVQLASDEVLSCTHSCFLTYRSIFVCLWNVTEGRAALCGLTSWLRMIQACVPGSPTIVAATHMDKASDLDPAIIVEWLNTELGDIHQLQSAHVAARRGFPPLVNVVTMTCSSSSDIELLMEDLYRFSSLLRRPGKREPIMEEQIPRLYLELQNLIELKVRAMKAERVYSPAMRQEEFLDYVRSLTFQYDDLEEGQEEFALACRFLHDAGTIVHFQSPTAGASDLYFLDLQWLSMKLSTVLLTQIGQRSDVGVAIVSSQRLSVLFQLADIVPQLCASFMMLMENYDIMVSLNMERTSFLFPSLLPQAPPPQYPAYDLQAEHVLVQYISMAYLPNGLFSRLCSRVVTYIRQLSVQLLATSSTPLLPEDQGEDEVDGAMAGKLSHHAPRSLYLDKRGYVCQRDGPGEEDELSLRQKLWALTLSMLGTSGGRYRSLTEKLLALSEPILKQQGVVDGPQGVCTVSSEFSSCVIWQRGLYAAFPQGAKFWLEVCVDGLVLLVGGAPLQKVKVLSFIVSCVTALVEESYRGLEVVPYSPCPTCLTRFWAQGDKGKHLSFAQSDLEPTTVTAVEDFVRTSPQNSSNKRRFVKQLRVEAEVENESIHFLGNEVPMFPVSLAVKNRSSKSVVCAVCTTEVMWKDVAPNILFLDFADRLLLKASMLQASDDILIPFSCSVLIPFSFSVLIPFSCSVLIPFSCSVLIPFSCSQVLKGVYNGSAVAVKVFQPPGVPGAPVVTPQWCYLALREELSIAGHLNNPRIVPLVGVCLKPLSLVMQLAPQGSLSKHLALCPSGLDPMVTHEVLLQIADGLQYLHSMYIIHRDVKASNVLVWMLHPQHGVDVRISDYGTSQFSTPLGLRGAKGTEEYMAPECFKKKMSYDEKVDIFSFGLLLFHVVTGRRLYTNNVLNNTGPTHSGSSSKFPSLSAALSSSFSEKHPTGAEHSAGVHQAARKDPLCSCYAVCMQPLLEACLSLQPGDRPTAQGLYSKLGVCPGSLPQANFITAEVKKAIYVPSVGVVLGQMGDSHSSMLEITPASWTVQTRRLQLPCQEEAVRCFVCAEGELYLCSESGLVFSLSLPHLSSGLIASSPLPSPPLSIFTHPDKTGTRVVVGLADGKVAIYSPRGSLHPLKSDPKMVTLFDHPDPSKIAVHCGMYHEGMLWCGCGRHVIVVQPLEDYELLHMRPASNDSTYVSRLVSSGKHVWASLHNSCELAVFWLSVDDRYSGLRETANTHAVLSMGLACFQRREHSEEALPLPCRVDVFNIWLLCQKPFVVQPKSLQFLLEHGFDFNKQYSRGIHYHPGYVEAIEEYSMHALFVHILKARKPIAVHNGLVDLVFLYRSFYGDLPQKLGVFMADLSDMFPRGIYDTKCISEFVTRDTASFLEYIFRKSQRDNEEWKACGRRHIELQFMDCRSLGHVDLVMVCSAVTREAALGVEICETYAHHGYCPHPSVCTKCHDVVVILEHERSKCRLSEAKRLQRKRNRDGGCGDKPPLEAAECEKKAVVLGNKSDTSGHLHQLFEQDLECMRTQLSRDAPPSDHKASVSSPVAPPFSHQPSVGHRSGFDAFMTGYSLLTFALHKMTKAELSCTDQLLGGLSDWTNCLALRGKDIPLRIVKSHFVKTSVDHRQGMGVWMCLWKLWKWLVHAFTGTCELYRIAYSKLSLEKRTLQIEQSLRQSKYKELNDIYNGAYDLEQSLAIVKRVKKLPDDCDERILPSLSRIVSLAALKKELEAMRSEAYSEDNTEHKSTLLQLWDLLMPSAPLEARITKEWQQIGFQGTDPATDFRGMGLLGLYCFHYFAAHHNGIARSIHLHSHHPKYGYPLAIVSIDLTSLLFGWTMSGIMDNYLHCAVSQWPISVEEFMEIHCYLLDKFDKFWISKDPENLMAFNAIRTEFASQLQQELIKEDIKIDMTLTST
eukprot:Em0011g33a